MPIEGEASNATDDLASVVSGLSLGGRSLHPSIAGTAISMACSEVTIGAGDDTGYWDYKHRESTRSDLGHNCRECREPFRAIGEPMTERRGARVSMRYHAECFSGFADPRSQATSSHHVGRLAGSQFEAAPRRKADSKMRSAAHFGHGGDSRYQGGGPSGTGSGNALKYGAHGGGFGAASSKPPLEGEPSSTQPRASAPGDLTEMALAAHNTSNFEQVDSGSGNV